MKTKYLLPKKSYLAIFRNLKNSYLYQNEKYCNEKIAFWTYLRNLLKFTKM